MSTASTEIQNVHLDFESKESDTVAVLTIRGQFHGGISFAVLENFLNENGLTHGMDRGAVDQLLKECAADAKDKGLVRKSAIVARGKPMKEGKDGSIEFMIKEKEKVKLDEDGTADFRNVQRFHVVKSEQTLARRTPSIPGQTGINIYGDVIPAPEVVDPMLEHGENIHYDEGLHVYVAKVTGIYIRKDDHFLDVSEVLKIEDDVGLETGNLIYDQSMKIGGNIDRGSKVRSKGDIQVDGMIESGDVKASGNIKVGKGINTNREGTVVAEGDIDVGYVENANIVVMGDFYAKTSIIGSRIITCGDLILKSKSSTIVGGELSIYGSIEVGSIGNKSEVATRITLGTHFRNAQFLELQKDELKEHEDAFKKLVTQVDKIKQYVSRMGKNLTEEKRVEFQKVFQSYKSTAIRLESLKEKVEKTALSVMNPGAVEVKVTDTIHPGVLFLYEGSSTKVTKKITSSVVRSVIRFSPDSHEAQIVPL